MVGACTLSGGVVTCTTMSAWTALTEFAAALTYIARLSNGPFHALSWFTNPFKNAAMDPSPLQAMCSTVDTAAVIAAADNATLLRPVGHATSALFVANAGATVGLPPHVIAQLCEIDGIPAKVHVPDPSKTFMYVLFDTEKLATEAMTSLLNAERVGRLLTVKYADLHPKAAKVRFFTQSSAFIPLKSRCEPVCVVQSLLTVQETPHVFLTSEEAGIPGLYLYHDFLTETEEHEILQSLGKEGWKDLAKRHVCHFGHSFEYMVSQHFTVNACFIAANRPRLLRFLVHFKPNGVPEWYADFCQCADTVSIHQGVQWSNTILRGGSTEAY